MTKAKQKGNPKFGFLFGGEYYNYYTYRVNAEQAILRLKSQQTPQVGYPTPHQHIGYPQQQPSDWPQPQPSNSWQSRSQPRPLMDIQTFPVQAGLSAPGVVIPQHLGSGPPPPGTNTIKLFCRIQ